MKKYWWYGLIFCVCIVLSVGYWRYSVVKSHQFKIFFLNVGQGDATVIQFRNGQRWLVDCGPDSSVLAQLGQVLPWYERSIDTLLVTHPDSDHYAGCIDVLKRYEVTRIVTNGETKPDELYQSFVRSVAEEPNSIAFAQQKPERLEIAGTMLEFLSPDPELSLKIPADDSNNRSIVFRLRDTMSGVSVMFTADMEEPLERALVKRYCSVLTSSDPNVSTPCPALQASVLKVGHHGSDTSSGGLLLNAVNPQTAIISSGKRNRFGHPSLRVVRRLERRGVVVMRTDTMGTVIVDE